MFRADAGARLSSNMAWVIVWVGLGLAVGLLVAATHGRDAATEHVAAYCSMSRSRSTTSRVRRHLLRASHSGRV